MSNNLILSMGKPDKQFPKRHIVLTAPIGLGLEIYMVIFDEVLNKKFRPVREILRKKEQVRYRFPTKYLDKLRLTFPYADIAPSLDARIAREARQRYETGRTPSVLVPGLGTKLFGHQKLFIQWWLDLEIKRAFLTDEMGLGKTLMSLGVIVKMGYEHTIAIVPNSAKWAAWAADTKKFTKLSFEVIDSEDKKEERVRKILSHPQLTIINYESAWRIPELKDMHYDFKIGDEFHRIKNPEARQTQGFFDIDADDVLLLSGTPILNGRIEELWSGLHELYPGKFPNFRLFQVAHCIYGGSGKVVAYSNLSKLRDEVDQYELRRRREEVIRDIPAKLPTRRKTIKLSPEARRLYTKIENELKLELQGGHDRRISDIRAKITRLKQACFSPELYGGNPTSTKIDDLKEMIAEITHNGHKALVGSQWARATRIIQRELAQYNPAYIDGSVASKVRSAEVDKFQNDDDCMVFIGSIMACREAITLTAATYVIFTDKGWVPAYHEQFVSRTEQRIGQKHSVNVIELFAEDTIEGPIEDLLQAKQNANLAWTDRKSGQVQKPKLSVIDIRELLTKQAH